MQQPTASSTPSCRRGGDGMARLKLAHVGAGSTDYTDDALHAILHFLVRDGLAASVAARLCPRRSPCGPRICRS